MQRQGLKHFDVRRGHSLLHGRQIYRHHLTPLIQPASVILCAAARSSSSDNERRRQIYCHHLTSLIQPANYTVSYSVLLHVPQALTMNSEGR